MCRNVKWLLIMSKQLLLNVIFICLITTLFMFPLYMKICIIVNKKIKVSNIYIVLKKCWKPWRLVNFQLNEISDKFCVKVLYMLLNVQSWSGMNQEVFLKGIYSFTLGQHGILFKYVAPLYGWNIADTA